MVIPILFLSQQFRVLLALITGAIGTFAFSPYDFWPAALISLSGLLLITLNRNSRQAGWLGFVWGLGLFGTGINWVYVSIAQFSELSSIVNIALVVMLAAYLSFYPMLFAVLLVIIWPLTNLWRLAFGAPVLWSITEFLRGRVLTGFPWLEFGYSQIDGPLKGIAPLSSVQAITFMLVMISGLMVYAFSVCRLWPAITALLLLFLPCPLRLLHWYQLQPERAVDVALVQGNTVQSIKWEVSQIVSTMRIYSHCTFPIFGKAQIIIWPESAIPDDEFTQNNFLVWFDKQLRQEHTHLITGIIDAHPTSYGYDYYNSIVVLGESIPYQYPALERYHKHHLVPFGETIPLASLFRPIALLFNLPMSSLSRGQYLQPQLRVAGVRLTATICYEIIFGDQVRDNFHPDTDFILTLSNDAWFGNSIGPWQHFQMARMRSLELGRPLLRSTNNGITAVINADGIPQAQLLQFTRDVLSVSVTPTRGITPYARFGIWPLRIITIIIGFIALFFDRRNYN